MVCSAVVTTMTVSPRRMQSEPWGMMVFPPRRMQERRMLGLMGTWVRGSSRWRVAEVATNSSASAFPSTM